MIKSNPCKLCGSTWHTKAFCPQNRKPLARSTKPIAVRKRPKQRGKQSFKWQEIRSQWIVNHPAPWYCYICGIPLDESTLTLDHVIPRSNAKNYANRHDYANLRPCCGVCNSAKGSKHLSNYQDI